MPHDPEKYLHDIGSCCSFLIEYTAEKTLEDYSRDRGFRSAVERELQIIGEAVMQLDRLTPTVAARIPEYQNIIGFRHVLVHGYDSLKHKTVWNVIESKLDALARTVQTLLEELGTEPTSQP